MEVFIEPLEPSPHLYIVGAGHVSQPPRPASRTTSGSACTCVDDREKFANRERFPDAAEIVVDDIASWLAPRRPAAQRPTWSS